LQGRGIRVNVVSPGPIKTPVSAIWCRKNTVRAVRRAGRAGTARPFRRAG
jgi:NAD(P)-dependent dehydrogenase (short-subunit alcohol dehydrogenase family)